MDRFAQTQELLELRAIAAKAKQVFWSTKMARLSDGIPSVWPIDELQKLVREYYEKYP